jgi:hypothetical protein
MVKDITDVLDGISMEYRQNASASILKSLDKLEADVDDAIYLKELFDLKDLRPEDAGWQIEGPRVDLQLAAEYTRGGNYKKARTLTDRAMIDEVKTKWRNGGTSYRRQLTDINSLNREIDPYIVEDNKNFAMFKYMQKIPTFGTQELNTLNLKEHTKKWSDIFKATMLDKEINWKGTPKGQLLHKAFNEGGVVGFTKELHTQTMAHNKINNENNLSSFMILDYLQVLDKNTHGNLFVPERRSYNPFGEWYEDPDDQGQAGAELFFNYYNTYLTLLSVGNNVSLESQSNQQISDEFVPSFMLNQVPQ